MTTQGVSVRSRENDTKTKNHKSIIRKNIKGRKTTLIDRLERTKDRRGNRKNGIISVSKI